MFIVIVAIIVLIAAVGAIYLLLKSMGEDGVAVAAPGSCKRGRCGVRADTGEAGQIQEQEALPESDENKRRDALPPGAA